MTTSPVSHSRVLFLIPVFGLLLIAGSLVLFVYKKPLVPRPPAASTLPAGPISLQGNIVCLPPKDSNAPHTLECALGLKDTSGRYFGLHDTSSAYQNISGVSPNVLVTVNGTFTPKEDEKYPTLGVIEVTSLVNPTAGWQVFSDSKLGLSFLYPPKLSTTYVSLVDWPPKANLVSQPFSCTPAGADTSRAGLTEQKTLDNRIYCVTREAEGAAGSVYTQYAYASSVNDKTIILTFSLRTPQCVNYEDPQKTACQQEQSSFNVDTLVNQIFQTLQAN